MMKWWYSLATLWLSLLYREVVAAQSSKRAPESQCQVLIHAASTLLPVFSLSLSVKLSLPCLAASLPDSTVAKTSWVTGWRAKLSGRLRPQAETPAPLCTSCPLGWVQSPHPGNMGLGGCSRQLFGNDTMRGFIGKAVSTCGCGGDDAAHVVLAAYMARCADVNQARSGRKRRSMHLVLHHNLFLNDFWQHKKLFSLSSILLVFIWCPYGCLWW